MLDLSEMSAKSFFYECVELTSRTQHGLILSNLRHLIVLQTAAPRATHWHELDAAEAQPGLASALEATQALHDFDLPLAGVGLLAGWLLDALEELGVGFAAECETGLVAISGQVISHHAADFGGKLGKAVGLGGLLVEIYL
jgi:hypothetical protein